MMEAIMMSPGKISFREVQVPKPSDNEVIIKIKRIGICGSDIHVYHGKHPYTHYPVIQGHEFSGEISEIGSGANKFKIGDKVVAQPQVVCGKCYPCRTGNYNICDNLKVMGFQTEGCAREYFKVDMAKVLKIPSSMSFDEGALVEPEAVACHCLGRSGLKIEGKYILILGAGPIGNLVAQTAKARGAGKVMITDISDFRLQKALDCGIDFAVNTSKSILAEEINKAFGADKADLILECAGVQEVFSQAVANARKGTDIIAVAVYPEEVKVNLGFIQDRELRIIGTLMYQTNDYLDAIDLINKKKIFADKLITDYYSFGDYDKAYQYIDKVKDKVMKVMIRMPD
jgi:L-iditol 2-dehydrogenase